jgi:hypothetical protein
MLATAIARELEQRRRRRATAERTVVADVVDRREIRTPLKG